MSPPRFPGESVSVGDASYIRSHGERRIADRRTPPSQRLDVSRLEHENLCHEMTEAVRVLRRIEMELRSQSERIARLEGLLDAARLPTPPVR